MYGYVLKKFCHFGELCYYNMFTSEEHTTIQTVLLVTEARHADIVATAAAISITSATVAILFVDVAAVKTSIALFIRNIRDVTSFKRT